MRRDTLGYAAAIAAAAFLMQMATATRYGYFRDEMYFLACAEHLDWGYVDHAPLIDWLAALSRSLLGDSLQAIRALPALVYAGTVLLTGAVARELGARRFGIGLAALCAATAPIMLGMGHLLTMNVLEPLLWLAAAFGVVLAITRENPRMLLWFGAAVGFGLLNKHSMAFVTLALLAGLAATRHRRLLVNRWMFAAGGLALLIYLPHLIWQVAYGFPILETLNTVRRTGKNVAVAPLDFMVQQVIMMGPAHVLVWGAGLWALARGSFRALAWTYVVVLALMLGLGGKVYYMAPIYPMLLAAGAVWWEGIAQRRRWVRLVLPGLVLAGGAITAPFTLPVLSPEGYVRYSQALGFTPPKTERGHTGPLPQHFGDMFGWPEMVEKVAAVYHSLPAEERAKAAIYAGNYGVAGAIDLLGPRHGLPKAISGHNNYWLWGPRDYTGEVVIVLGDRSQGARRDFASMEVGPEVNHPWAMAYERWHILIGRGLKKPLREAWPEIRFYN